MLSLGPGVRQYDDIVVMPDYSDPLQFFYLPPHPHLSTLPDGKPAIRLILFKKDLSEVPDDAEDAVGFLLLDVDLSVDPERLEEVRRKIRSEMELPELPQLSPIFFRSGTAELLLLDARSKPEDAPGDEPKPTEFVTRVFGSASPSLFGDNRAIFQATLTKKGAIAVVGSLEGLTPIGVVYSLTFAGLQPAYTIKVDVDWDKAYSHISERDQFTFLFYRHDVTKVVDELVDKRIINVVDVIEGVDAEGAVSDHDAVMNQVRQLILDTFFKQELDPETPVGGGIVGEVLDSIVLFPGYCYRRKELNQHEVRSLDLNWSVRKAVNRTIYPQAHLHTLVGATLTRDDLVTVVDGTGADWRVLPIDVSAVAAWKEDGVAVIAASVSYGDPADPDSRTWDLRLTEAEPRAQKRDWLDPASRHKLRWRYAVEFGPDAPPGPSTRVEAPEIEQDGAVVVMNPRALYDAGKAEVEVSSAYGWDRWPTVHVAFRYVSADESFRHEAGALLTRDNRKFTTRWRTLPGDAGRRELRVRHHAPGGEPVDTGWLPMEEEHASIGNPISGKLDVRVIPAVDATVASLMVALRYDDDDGGVHESTILAFDQDNMGKGQAWSIALASPEADRRYAYQVTIVKKTGELIETDWITTDKAAIAIGETTLGTLEVEAEVDGWSRKVRSIRVDLVYEDAVNDLREEATLSLAPGSSSTWKIRIKDPARRQFQYTATWEYVDGFEDRVGPLTETRNLIVLPPTPADR